MSVFTGSVHMITGGGYLPRQEYTPKFGSDERLGISGYGSFGAALINLCKRTLTVVTIAVRDKAGFVYPEASAHFTANQVSSPYSVGFVRFMFNF